MNEPVYCFNCDNEAVVYVDWVWNTLHGVEPHRTFMCRTCADAFEFGQCTPERIESIEHSVD